MQTELKEFIAQALGCDSHQLDDNSELGITPGWDSMAYLQLLTAMEKKYGIEIDEEIVEKFRKMSAIIKLDESHTNTKDIYSYWDNPNLIEGFNHKSANSFFASETYFLKQMNVPSLKTVLDVGCSCGRFIELLRSMGYTQSSQHSSQQAGYTGVDISDASIQICRKNYPNLDFHTGNFLSYESPISYELVNATGVVQHEPNYKNLIAKMLRDSSRYVLFDVKLCNSKEPIVDIEKCYCQLEDSRIHMICFSYQHLIDVLFSLKNCGKVSLYGYKTPPNAVTHGPADIINQWASCGVFIDKKYAMELGEVNLPDFIIR